MSAVITPFGIQADSQAQIMQNLSNAMRDIYGQNIEISPNAPDGQMVGIFAQDSSDVTELTKNLFASLFPSTAEGVFLDYNLDLIGLNRIEGRYASVNLNVEFDEPQNIAAGTFIVQIQGISFANNDAITAAGIYKFNAMEYISMQFAPDEPVQTLTNIFGVSVSFADTLSNGEDFETDYNFRNRWQDYVNVKDHSAPYIEGRLRQVEGVVDCNVYEVDNTPFDTLPLNCIYAVLKPGNFDYNEVLEMIFKLKAGGIQAYYENTEPAQSKAFGRGNIRVGFDLAQFVKIENYAFNFYSKLNDNPPIDESDVLAVLQSMDFRINQTVFVSDVNNYVMSKMPHWFADRGNNINGSNFLEGQIRVIYEF